MNGIVKKIAGIMSAVVCMGSAVVSAYAAPVLTDEDARVCSTVVEVKPELVEETERAVFVAEVSEKGDINGDNVINVVDVAALAAHIKGDKIIDTDAADINSDGFVNITDLSLLSVKVKGNG